MELKEQVRYQLAALSETEQKKPLRTIVNLIVGRMTHGRSFVDMDKNYSILIQKEVIAQWMGSPSNSREVVCPRCGRTVLTYIASIEVTSNQKVERLYPHDNCPGGLQPVSSERKDD